MQVYDRVWAKETKPLTGNSLFSANRLEAKYINTLKDNRIAEQRVLLQDPFVNSKLKISIPNAYSTCCVLQETELCPAWFEWMDVLCCLSIELSPISHLSFALCCSAAKLRAATPAWIIFSTGHIIYIKFSLTSSEKFSLNPLQFTISKYLLSTFKGQEIISLEIKRPLFIGVDLRKINSLIFWMSERSLY